MQGLQIDVVDSPLCLEAVKKLWKANAHTLGFFPDGAFQDAFAKGWILGATDRNTRFAGYLLYRLSKGVATIVHLCVAKELRGEGIARSLVERLIEVTGNCRGIALKCRRDFPASGLWPQLGFTLQGEVPGRGRHRKPLLCWWRDQKNADLFSDAAARLRESKVCAVIDANVLFDLMHEELEFESSSNALRADWLADTLELFITEEIFIEIDRNPDPVAKRKNRAFAATFPCLPCDTTRFDHVRGALRPLFGETMTEQDHSDLRQLAWAIAADSPFLVTRDAGLLGLAERVKNDWGLMVLSPTDLITRLDEVRRTSQYQPARFAGTHLKTQLIANPRQVSERLHNQERGEKQRTFEERLDGFLARRDTYTCSVLLDQDQEPLGMVVSTGGPSAKDRVEVPMLRVAKGRLAPTLARQMIRQCILLARKASCEVILVTDQFLTGQTEVALADLGFLRIADGWLKISLYAAEVSSEIADRIAGLSDQLCLDPERSRKWQNLLRDPNQVAIREFASDQEHMLWPAKIVNSDLPSYIVPIRPHWAQELFDERLANQDLFGRKVELALNTEGAYYRSARGPKFCAPGRILWYVSDERDRDLVGPKHVRACSRLNDVEVGLPKDLYRKYEHLGVYDWRQVYETANFDLNQEIMVLRFSDTEPFPHPVHWERLQELLREEGVTSQLQSPLPISASLFVRLYTEGVGE